MRIVITGGAGFIGCNAADAFLREGHEVVVLDNLSRPGSALNLAWLRQNHPRLRFIQADIREYDRLREHLGQIAPLDGILHLASQVAVTSSVRDPRQDFDINALGTLNVLEALRAVTPEAVLLYASTNKVYGGLEHVGVVPAGTRYQYRDRPHGISEAEPLDFHSPYGCSKGAADQYVRDYARIYGLRTVVLRQSCIYGRRQYGVEDQGWVAWFALAALSGRPITIYGDGRQVRDVLFVDDLIAAYRLALRNPAAWGDIFNLGGGPAHTMSVWSEFGPILERLLGRSIPVTYADWRPGDQRIFVSDIRKAQQVLGWQPTVGPEAGIAALVEWAAAELERTGSRGSGGRRSDGAG